jgi:prepilin-type N-terminal cleavage/methylation domain-containing protein
MKTVPLVPRPQGGFSLVELLMAAFIMAVGLLGLGMLQAYAIRTTSTAKNMTMAVKIGERSLDAVAAEGRQRLLITRTSTNPDPSQDLPPTTRYFGGGSVTEYYTGDGTNQAARDGNTVFTVVISPAAAPDYAEVSGMAIKSYTATVTYNQAVDPKNASKTIQKTLTLTRKVGYANS